MAEITPQHPRHVDKTPRSYATEPPRPIDEMEPAPGVVLRSELNYIEPRHNTFVVSVLTMVFTSLVTFYIPFFNGILGGTFGGFHARRWGRAIGAAVLNSILVPAILLAGYGWDQPDFLRFFYGLGFNGWLYLHIIGTFIGMAFGVLCRPLVDERRDLLVETRTPATASGPTVTAEHSEVQRALNTEVVKQRDT